MSRKNNTPEYICKKRALNVVKQISKGMTTGRFDKKIGIGTLNNTYKPALERVALHAFEKGIDLKDLSSDDAKLYLEDRAIEVGQKHLNNERRAIEVMFQAKGEEIKLPVFKSIHEEVLTCRSYTNEQVLEIAKHQVEKNAVSTLLCLESGLRAHELLTINRIDDVAPDLRPVHDDKFLLKEDYVAYSVSGKGGLVREVRLPSYLSEKLEERRFDAPLEVKDRGINYSKNYDIGAGNAFSKSFTRASVKALGFSNGAHGLRHSYAQNRMDELKTLIPWDFSLEVVSQEMGHFRSSITLVYLR